MLVRLLWFLASLGCNEVKLWGGILDVTSTEGGEVGNNEIGYGFFDQVRESATDEVNLKYISLWFGFHGHLIE